MFHLISIEKNEEGGRVSSKGQWERRAERGEGRKERMQGEHKEETQWQHKDRNKDNGHKAGC